MRKIKVTKKVVAKTPWYEKPPLLFGAIAGLLLVSGIVMAHLNTRSKGGGIFGAGGPDTLATSADSALTAQPALSVNVLRADAALPPARPGVCLPPVRVETLREAAAIREKLREARGLVPLADLQGASGGAYAFARGAELLATLSAGTPLADLWSRLTLSGEFDPAEHFELQREDQDHVYLVALVSPEVGEALGELGARIQLTDPPSVEEPPKWQFWRKTPAPEKLTLYRGTEITLYPHLSPEATCLVALPLDRIEPLATEQVQLGRELPERILRVALK